MKDILVIDDDSDLCLLLDKFFTKKGFSVNTASDGESGIRQLKKSAADLVICDFKLPDYTGIEILQKIKIISPESQVIIITGYSDVNIAVNALKKGAFDYVTKPLYPDELFLTVQNALKADSSSVETKPQQKKSKAASGVDFIVGSSQQSMTVQKHVELIAPTDMSVIILGETGTGKEYVARAIHQKSKRVSGPFVAIDCGALPKDLAGSELFGHVKGAFTGALSDKEGCFERANGGTLFLDEIGNLSYENQIQLLRVLQERKVRKVGGNKEIPVDVRVLVATNEDLKKQALDGEFREDIYHRLNEFKIELSPIRERPKDVITFAEYFLNHSNDQLQKEVSGFDEEVQMIFKRYPWPGNLRELKNVVKRSVLLCQGSEITSDNLPVEIVSPEALVDENHDLRFPKSLKQVVEQAERNAILATLKQTNNNKSKTAELLEIDRKTLYNKLNAYQIEV